MSVHARWRDRREERRARRTAQDIALAKQVTDRTTAIVEVIAAPLEKEGLVRVKWPARDAEWRGPESRQRDPDESGSIADGLIELLPTRPDAAEIAISVAPDWITVCPGLGWGHEILVSDQDWEYELRSCVEAVVEGRYREQMTPARWTSWVLTMIFERPDAENIVVKHYGAYKGAEDDLVPGERRYAAYG